jgi:hypothetical protein
VLSKKIARSEASITRSELHEDLAKAVRNVSLRLYLSREAGTRDHRNSTSRSDSEIEDIEDLLTLEGGLEQGFYCMKPRLRK